jgi:hypothetical protein
MVSFATTLTGANHVRLACTAAPMGSALRKRLDATSGVAVDVYSGPSINQWLFAPDVAGAYVFTAYECTVGASQYGGGYFGDSDSDTSETVLDSNTLTISVGSRLETKLGVGSNTATLVCYVFGSTIRATTESDYGERTPAITKPSSAKGITAVENAATRALVATLDGVSAATAIGDPESMAATLVIWFEAHRVKTSVHASADGANSLIPSLFVPSSANGLAATLNDLRTKVERHMRNDAAGAGTGTAAYHAPSGIASADLSVGFQAPPASPDNRASQILLLADLMRVMTAHASSSVHASPDTGGFPLVSILIGIHIFFLFTIAASSPTAAANANAGSTLLVHSGGFSET